MMMYKLIASKKGYQVSDIAPIAIALGLAIIVTVVMANVVTNVQTDQVTNTDGCNSTDVSACGYGYNVSSNGLSGLDELGSWFDTIGLVVAAAIIIGILVYAFAFRK